MPTLGPSLEDLLKKDDKKAKDDNTATGKLEEKMTEIKIKDKEREVEAKATVLGLEYINLVGFPIGPDSLTTISEEDSKKNKIICFFNDGEAIRLGAVDYNDNVRAIEADLEKTQFANVSTYLISEFSFKKAFVLYATLPKIRKFTPGIDIAQDEIERFEKEVTTFKDLNEKIQGVSVTELVSLLMAGAIKSRASDLHIEAEEKGIKVRYRIDGVLNDVGELKKEVWKNVISRVKQLAKLKINVADKPQDGRFSVNLAEERIDVRVSTLPTAFGESVVIRLLMSSATKLEFDDLGIRGQAYEMLKKEIDRPNGMIITTGPTGSGKTTTLYSILKKLNNPETKIITIEDPIEYELKGINQSQVNKNFQFAQGLRSIVRQDPDIVMVGEIRDLETAEIAIQASLTGHLVLSTIHTNDAFGTIPRFLALGAKPFLLAPALNVAIGQRLVRRVCSKCEEGYTPSDEVLEKVKKMLSEIPEKSGYQVDIEKIKFKHGKGCDVCQGLGFKGRVGIYEIMPIEDEIEELIHRDQVSEVEVKEIANKMGIITMAQDGMLKAIDGITTPEEVLRVAE